MTDKERELAVIEHRGIVIDLAIRFYNSYSHLMEQEDMASEGYVGMVEALNSYEIGKGRKLSSWIYLCVVNHLCFIIKSLLCKKRYDPDISFTSIDQDVDGNEELSLHEVIPSGLDQIEDVLYELEYTYVQNQLTKEEIDLLEWIIGGYPLTHYALMTKIPVHELTKRKTRLKEKISFLIEKA